MPIMSELRHLMLPKPLQMATRYLDLNTPLCQLGTSRLSGCHPVKRKFMLGSTLVFPAIR